MLDIYFVPWCRVGPYAVGLLLGYILHTTRCSYTMTKVSDEGDFDDASDDADDDDIYEATAVVHDEDDDKDKAYIFLSFFTSCTPLAAEFHDQSSVSYTHLRAHETS